MRGRLLSLLSWLRLESRVGTAAPHTVSCFLLLYLCRLYLLIHLANPSVMLDGGGWGAHKQMMIFVVYKTQSRMTRAKDSPVADRVEMTTRVFSQVEEAFREVVIRNEGEWKSSN